MIEVAAHLVLQGARGPCRVGNSRRRRRPRRARRPRRRGSGRRAAARAACPRSWRRRPRRPCRRRRPRPSARHARPVSRRSSGSPRCGAGSRLSPSSVSEERGIGLQEAGDEAIPQQARRRVAPVGVEAVADHAPAVALDVGDDRHDRDVHLAEVDVGVFHRRGHRHSRSAGYRQLSQVLFGTR